MGVVKIKDLYKVSQLSDEEIVRRAHKAAKDLLAEQAEAALLAAEEEKGKKGGKKAKAKTQKEKKAELPARGPVQCSLCGISLSEPLQEREPR